MPRTDLDTHASLSGGNGATATRAVDRRRPTLARFRFRPDPRDLRALLAEVESRPSYRDAQVQRRVRLLVGEIVARLLRASAGTSIELAIEVKPDSVRVDVWDQTGEPCDFFERLDSAFFSDLASSWGRDRRRPCGAWFELPLNGRAS